MSAIIDLKQNARITVNKNGKRIDRTAIVSGLTGDINTLLESAITDGALPNYGDAYPTDSAITLNSITAEPKSGGDYLIRMSYFTETGSETGSANATSRASATTVSEETKLDITGAAMTTQYIKDGAIISERFTADIERPRVTFDFEYISATFPQATINTYLGKINSVIWNGYAVETILCTAVNVSQQGAEYQVRMSFAYNADTWAFLARTSYAPPLTDHGTSPDAGLDNATGTRPYDVYSTVDFTALGLTL